MSDTEISAAPAKARYSTVAIILHWTIAVLLIFEVGLGLNMESLKGPAKFALFQLHKTIGITILLLVVLRVLWRFYRRPPAMTVTGWERALAQGVHGLFYLVLFALPISGWIIVSTSKIVVLTLLFGVVPWPDVPGVELLGTIAKETWHDAAEFIHVNFVNILYALFALHVAGALKHHVIDRQGDLARMVPGIRPGALADPRLVLIALGVFAAAALGFQWTPALPETAVVRTTDERPAPSDLLVAQSAPEAVDAASARGSAATAEETSMNAKAEQGKQASEEVSSWAIAPGSTVGFKTSWSGMGIDGGFARFDGDIRFSPDQLDRSAVEIRVQTSSIFSGDAQRDETLKSDDWFAVVSHGVAVFKADRFRKTGADRYLANGSLRLKGVTLPLTLPFTLTINGNKAIMRGSASIDRTAYKIGEGDYAATDEIPAAVRIDVLVNATRK